MVRGRGARAGPLVAPLLATLALVAVFFYVPAASALYHSLFRWDGTGRPIYRGLANYVELLTDPRLAGACGNLALLAAGKLAIGLTVPFAVAELIHRLRSARAAFAYRVLFALPMVVPGMVVILLWRHLFQYEYGAINQLLRALGLGALAPNWLGDPGIALVSLILMGLPWVGSVNLLIYHAGLDAIPPGLREAAALDGAGALAQVLRVDLPLVLGQVRLLAALGIIGVIQVFDFILILTDGGPGHATMVPGLLMYKEAFTFGQFGKATALGVLIFGAILALTLSNLRVLRRRIEL